MIKSGASFFVLALGLVGYSSHWRISPFNWSIEFNPKFADSLHGRVAVVTGASRGLGRGFALGLLEAGAKVYVTGRSEASLTKLCKISAQPSRCKALVVDSSDDESLTWLFQEVSRNEGGKLDILVNNAYNAIGYASEKRLAGKPFWETGTDLYDRVFEVGVRSHYKATVLAVPLLKAASKKGDRGLIVNSNSPGCTLYALSVPYGIGKCAIDKMTADMAMELQTEDIDIVSWWAGVPVQTEEATKGGLDGNTWRRGLLPGLQYAARFDTLTRTALSTSPLFEGRTLAKLAMDGRRYKASGLAVVSATLGRSYKVMDERGVYPAAFNSMKYQLALWLPWFRDWATIDGLATGRQQFYFNSLPDISIPIWLLKVIGGPPLTLQWPLP